MSEAGSSIDAAAGGPGFSCSLTAVLIARVRRSSGEQAVEQLLREAGTERTVGYLTDLGNWLAYDETIALLEAGIVVTGDAELPRRVGEDFVSQLAGSSNSTVLRALGSPEELLRRISTASHRFSTAADLDAIDVRPGRAEIVAIATGGVDRHRLHCQWTRGLLSQATVLFGLPPANVFHEACQAEGAECCRYLVTWETGVADQPAADDAVVLRGELDAMAARLQSVFDTAADLIGSGDLDGTLARITDRAALQVRAPQYLLAVRQGPGGELLCHQKGFDADEARSVADLVMEADPADLPEHWLVAPVCSQRNQYGALLAAQQPGTRFFEHERRLLEVYARYAATALDSATALSEAQALHEEAQRRYEESRTLLELARHLARAGSSDQVARRLAAAVHGVVDCDRVGVYLWDEDARCLMREVVEVSVSGHSPETGPRAIRPEESSQLAAWLEHPDPEPAFYYPDDADHGALMRELGTVVTVSVPLATANRFLGTLTVAVHDRPERLERTPELVDRLSGVAAQAVIALENGRLVDQIIHQARHDQLTGAANRAGFHARLSAATQELESSIALFYIDLDDFKPINDEHGHEVGDALLRSVAGRLMGTIRGEDTLARLGGDEFVVLVHGVTGAAELDAISRRLRDVFADAFILGDRRFSIRASIGVAEHTGEAADELLRRADAAMYDDKRRARESASAAGYRR